MKSDAAGRTFSGKEMNRAQIQARMDLMHYRLPVSASTWPKRLRFSPYAFRAPDTHTIP